MDKKILYMKIYEQIYLLLTTINDDQYYIFLKKIFIIISQNSCVNQNDKMFAENCKILWNLS